MNSDWIPRQEKGAIKNIKSQLRNIHLNQKLDRIMEVLLS